MKNTNLVNLCESLLNGMESSCVSAVNGAVVNLSTSAAQAVECEINANLPKYKKMAKTQRVKVLLKLIDRMNLAYPKDIEDDEASAVVVLASTPKHRGKPARPVYQFDKHGNFIGGYESVQAAHRASGVSDASICYCCLGKPGFKSAGGYKWSYEKSSK